MSLLRIPLILAVAAGNQKVLTAPNAPPQSDEKLIKDGLESFFLKTFTSAPTLVRGLVWAGCICETLVILAHRFPYNLLSARILSLLDPRGSAYQLHITKYALLGIAIAYAGTFCRLASYRELGHLFTYELSIRSNHKLITTGPYSIVRHPSYTSSAITFTGVAISMMGKDSWFAKSGLAQTNTGRILAGAWAAYTVFLLSMFVRRTKREDALMKEQFGAEWEEWRKQVPYRLIPFIV